MSGSFFVIIFLSLLFVDFINKLHECGLTLFITLVDAGVLKHGSKDTAGLLKDNIQSIVGIEAVALLKLIQPYCVL